MSNRKSNVASKILMSACLLGENTRYDGGHNRVDTPIIESWKSEGRILSICPEIEGGLPIPHPPAEVINADGDTIIDGKGKVVDVNGKDVTEEFMLGAQKALQLARDNNIELALLKARSPSCGIRTIYDGTFSNTLKPGKGVTAALLTRNGIHVFNEDEIEAAEDYLKTIESTTD
jgi:uncharacterized protein YbbK (DUF523 family)